MKKEKAKLMPKVSSEAVRAHFDRQAPDWDQRFRRDPEKLRKILTLTGIMPGEQILEIKVQSLIQFSDSLDA